MQTDSRHEFFMRRALKLAAKAQGKTSPNPMVGALLVKNDKIIAEGYHHRSGEAHAEKLVLDQAGKKARNATLYVTLEPCCHNNKKTAPCANQVIQSGIKELVVASLDPNPQVKGRGIKKIRSQGITVLSDILNQEALALNKIFNHWIVNKIPYVILKTAMTLNAKIADDRNTSKWISSEKSRQDAHRQRAHVDAIMLGKNTVVKDNPSLNVRSFKINQRDQPRAVVLDSHLQIDLKSNLIRPGTIFFCDANAIKSDKAKKIEAQGVNVFSVRKLKSGLSLKQILNKLGSLDITSLIVEGGSSLQQNFIEDNLFQELQVYLAPKLITEQGLNAFQGLIKNRINNPLNLRLNKVDVLEQDVKLTLMVEN